MRVRSGKRFALGTVVLGLILICISGVFFYRPILCRIAPRKHRDRPIS